MAQKNTIDELAAEMEAILNDDTYRSVFERPRIKMASAEETAEPEKNPIEVAYEQLVEASKILDDLGLVKSAELTLSAVETLLSEAQPEDDEDDEEEEEQAKKTKTQEVKPGEDKPAKDKPEQQKAKTMPAPGGAPGAKRMS